MFVLTVISGINLTVCFQLLINFQEFVNSSGQSNGYAKYRLMLG